MPLKCVEIFYVYLVNVAKACEKGIDISYEWWWKCFFQDEEENDIGDFVQVEVDVDAAEKLMVGRCDQNLQFSGNLLFVFL